MKISIWNGSPREQGNTARLAAAFAAGASEVGHSVQLFDIARLNIQPCLACNHCRKKTSQGICVQKDDMPYLYQSVDESDMLVLATPLYFFGFCAQIKTAIDRLYMRPQLTDPSRCKLQKLALLAVCGSDYDYAMDGLLANYSLICDHFNIDNAGEVLAFGVISPDDILEHPSLLEAAHLGRNLT